MSARYRRGSPSRRDEVGAAAVSILVGAGAAAVTYYLTRLFLSREALAPEAHGEGTTFRPSVARDRLPSGTTSSPTDD